MEVDDAALAATTRRYTLPPEHAQVLLDRDSMMYLVPYMRMSVAAAQQLPALAAAYRGGAAG